ncbi:hypothetical protein OH738_29015 [Streptomyces hirsutus]|uniref:Uncharacterized protein n=1 Tax=Streptomyces hirsutus TaxID=35620 RepID=A0ABZ1GLK2_9ACTN|nr:hypothetical protein [Streptomyces hirsutus]WSD06182.1 hypothetical protein OIE73_10610 [Streptomyces hirsutus]WTD20394.1 hypothetical protein OH738_29015 [Streptomyces hirsutus]
MNARLTWSIVAGALALAVVAVLLVYGEHTGVILGRIGLLVF